MPIRTRSLRPAGALLLALAAAACASGHRRSAPHEVSAHALDACPGRRVVEVRNQGAVPVDVYARGSSGPTAGNFLRAVAAGDVARIPFDGLSSAYAMVAADAGPTRAGQRARQVAFRYLCE